MTETKRDLNADLSICDAATAGPWTVDVPYENGGYARIKNTDMNTVIAESNVEDARFIAEARTGWPSAIRRAMDAEGRAAHFEDCALNAVAEVERLQALLDGILDDHDCSLSTRDLIEEALKNGG